MPHLAMPQSLPLSTHASAALLLINDVHISNSYTISERSIRKNEKQWL